MFELPEEIFCIILSFLNPRDFQALQCTTRHSLLSHYRRAKAYLPITGQLVDEQIAFQNFQHQYFFDHLTEKQHVPSVVLRRIVNNQFLRGHVGVELFDQMRCHALNMQGEALLAAMHRSTLPARNNTDWGIFIAINVYAKTGTLAPLAVSDERDMAIALVKFGRQLRVQSILKGYAPCTPEMVMCMLHYNMYVDPEILDTRLLTQALCDYWIIKICNRGTKWLMNNLPKNVSIANMLACNSRLVFDYASKKTLLRYGFITKREYYTRLFPYFFHGLLFHRKRCGLSLKDLGPLSQIHIECHGTIAFLTTRNHILQRSRVFHPSLNVLRVGAAAGDNFFSMWVNNIEYLSMEEKEELKLIAGFAKRKANRTYLPFLFSEITDRSILSYESLLQMLGNCPNTYISCEPKCK